MKTNRKMSLRTRLTLRALIVREKIREHLEDCGGLNQQTDNAGLIVLGVVATIVTVVWAVPFTRDTLLPQIGQKIQDIFNYAN